MSYLGELVKLWEATCAGCERTEVSAGDKGWAASDMRRNGWALRQGLWNCPACKDDPTAVNLRFRTLKSGGKGDAPTLSIGDTDHG